MRIEKDVHLIMREMIADPEKDWSNHLPFIKLTEEDFAKGEQLIRRHIKNAEKRESALRDNENYKTRGKD